MCTIVLEIGLGFFFFFKKNYRTSRGDSNKDEEGRVRSHLSTVKFNSEPAFIMDPFLQGQSASVCHSNYPTT